MKKIVAIILILLNVLCASASPVRVCATMNYSSTYKGAGHYGYVHSTSHTHNASTGLASAPVASMGSVGRSMGTMPAFATTAVVQTAAMSSGIYTSASAVRGGVTTYDVGQMTGPRRTGGNPGGGMHNWEDNGDGTFTCTICGETISEDDFYDENYPPLCTPIGDGWPVWLFMTALAMAYTIYKASQRRDSDVQDGRHMVA